MDGGGIHMELLKQGSRGAAVRMLQLQLRALGHDVGDIDGVFGPRTHDAVLAFQHDTDSIDVDGIVGPESAEALKQALVMKETEPFHDVQPAHPQASTAIAVGAQAGVIPVDAATWHEVMHLKDLLTSTPVRYGPGRGLFKDGEWVITKGPGRLNSTQWLSKNGGTFASFHCSSLTST